MKDSKQALLDWLFDHGACHAGYEWVKFNHAIQDHKTLWKALLGHNFGWMWWYFDYIADQKASDMFTEFVDTKISPFLGYETEKISTERWKKIRRFFNTKIDFDWSE